MDRRRFFKNSSKLAALFPLSMSSLDWIGVLSTSRDSEMPEWLLKLIEINDGNVDRLLKYLITDSHDPQVGGIKDAYQMATAHSATGFLRAGMCGLLAPSSKYYKDKSLLEQLSATSAFLLKTQHEDGTIDLVTTNFHSTPDTAFIVKWLVPIYRVLEASNISGKETLIEPLHAFFINAGEALKRGGIHTPNHRWVVCAALAELNGINKDEGYLQRAEEWLAEGIDLDPDGQYEERSSYIYSSLSDRVLISTARGFEKMEILDYVRKNLEMTFYYLHPNGEIVTEASGRQDNSLVATLEPYYYPYRFMALRDNNGQFATACKLIEETCFDKASGYLYFFLEDKTMWEELPKAEPLPTHYVKKFLHSGLIRIRRGDYDGSILLNNPVFFTFHKLRTVLQGVRLASAFFGKGQFKGEHFEERDGAFVLSSELEGPYYQPFGSDEVSGDGDWSKMPRSEREQSEVQRLRTSVEIRELESGFELTVEAQGTDGVPLALELIFRGGGRFQGLQEHPEMEKVHFLREGKGKYEIGGEVLEFGPGLQEHNWVEIRGALPRMDSPTVFLTGFTPFFHRIQFR